MAKVIAIANQKGGVGYGKKVIMESKSFGIHGYCYDVCIYFP